MGLSVLRFATMFSGLAATAVVLAAGGTPLVEVLDGSAVKDQMGNRVAVFGHLERVPMSKGNGQWSGTAVVLDDDTKVYVTYREPPEGWAPLVGQRIRVEGLLRPTAGEHEQSLLAPHLRDPGKPSKAPRPLKAMVGKRVRIAGTAQNAKGGAVLLVEKTPLYLAGLEAWPAGVVLGKPVIVGGTIVDRQYLPEASKSTKGEVSQGAVGTQLVIEAPVVP
jgi:hypothetical protein